ncbi:MAG: response regulator [Anaerolineae bacterium]|nr:response regulator [Anaerolineae bacterium]
MTHKLLIVDDHPETLEIVSRVLRQQGYAVTAVSSGLQALALADAEQPDLILLDGMMPDLDGWEVCRRIRNNPKIARTPIIMFSAVNVAEQKLAGFNAGADDYLTKPTEPVELIERVQTLLENVPVRPELADAVPPETLPTSKTVTNGRTMTLASHSQVVAVLGARGGAGTTLLSTNFSCVPGQPRTPYHPCGFRCAPGTYRALSESKGSQRTEQTGSFTRRHVSQRSLCAVDAL